MTIDASLKSAEGQELTGRVASAFGIDEQKAGEAVAALAAELKARIERSMLSRGGVADVVSLVTNPAAGRALTDPVNLAAPDVAATGDHILDVLIGNKHISRGIAARAAATSDLDAGTLEKLLPVVANVLIGQLKRQSQPAIEKLVQNVPGLVSAGGSPLSMPGDTLPPIGTSYGSPTDGAPAGYDPPAAPRGSIDAGRPLPIPGDNIPGLGRTPRQPEPAPDNPYDRLPDIIRRGGEQAPGGGGSLENVIRSILGSLLGSNRGVIGTMIQLFLIRWVTSLVRRILSRTLTGH